MRNKIYLLLAYRLLKTNSPRSVKRLNLDKLPIFVIKARCLRTKLIQVPIRANSEFQSSPQNHHAFLVRVVFCPPATERPIALMSSVAYGCNATSHFQPLL